jgi:hypothetical protein
MSKPKVLLFDEMECKKPDFYNYLTELVNLELIINNHYNYDLNGVDGIIVHSPDYLHRKDKLDIMMNNAKSKKLPVFFNLDACLLDFFREDFFNIADYENLYYSTDYNELYNQIKKVFYNKPKEELKQ